MDISQNQNTTGNAPSLFAYHVKKGEQKSFWTRIGAAFPHKDGNGFNVVLECIPVDGKITLRTNSEE